MHENMSSTSRDDATTIYETTAANATREWKVCDVNYYCRKKGDVSFYVTDPDFGVPDNTCSRDVLYAIADWRSCDYPTGLRRHCPDCKFLKNDNGDFLYVTGEEQYASTSAMPSMVEANWNFDEEVPNLRHDPSLHTVVDQPPGTYIKFCVTRRDPNAAVNYESDAIVNRESEPGEPAGTGGEPSVPADPEKQTPSVPADAEKVESGAVIDPGENQNATAVLEGGGGCQPQSQSIAKAVINMFGSRREGETLDGYLTRAKQENGDLAWNKVVADGLDRPSLRQGLMALAKMDHAFITTVTDSIEMDVFGSHNQCAHSDAITPLFDGTSNVTISMSNGALVYTDADATARPLHYAACDATNCVGVEKVTSNTITTDVPVRTAYSVTIGGAEYRVENKA